MASPNSRTAISFLGFLWSLDLFGLLGESGISGLSISSSRHLVTVLVLFDNGGNKAHFRLIAGRALRVMILPNLHDIPANKAP